VACNTGNTEQQHVCATHSDKNTIHEAGAEAGDGDGAGSW